jgi:hypothetical protein
MKRIYTILLILFAVLSLRLSAQEPPPPPRAQGDSVQTAAGAERIQALKVAFITEHLKLTPAEAEKFWPVYNEYQDKKEAIRKQLHENRKKVREQADQLSDEELTRLADEDIRLRQQEIALQAEMHEKLKKILPPKKLAQLYVAEDDFKREIVRILTEEKRGTKPPKGNSR